MSTHALRQTLPSLFLRPARWLRLDDRTLSPQNRVCRGCVRYSIKLRWHRYVYNNFISPQLFHFPTPLIFNLSRWPVYVKLCNSCKIWLTYSYGGNFTQVNLFLKGTPSQKPSLFIRKSSSCAIYFKGACNYKECCRAGGLRGTAPRYSFDDFWGI